MGLGLNSIREFQGVQHVCTGAVCKRDSDLMRESRYPFPVHILLQAGACGAACHLSCADAFSALLPSVHLQVHAEHCCLYVLADRACTGCTHFLA